MAIHQSEYQEHFKTFHKLRLPKPLRVFAALLIIAVLIIIGLLIITPWVQTSSGEGRITALTPDDREQTINALVSGRINKWYVQDGMKVKKGDILVDIQDNDPDYFERLQSERDAIANKLEAAKRAASTSKINYKRQRDLFDKGLSAKKDYEDAQIKLEELRSKVESAKAELNKSEVKLSRQTTQHVMAAQDGTVIKINAGDAATFIKAGQPIATFLPDNVTPAAEIYVNGLDAPLIDIGREVQLIFEGWPAVQFSGWPSIAKGTFKGKVQFVDPSLSQNGRIRILVVETEEDPWPSSDYLRFGTRVRGWVLLNTVPLGYELWRQMNNFPPEFTGEQKASLLPKIKKGK